jgi:MurNAc alpha-1-phosphate uridylyltransferase
LAHILVGEPASTSPEYALSVGATFDCMNGRTEMPKPRRTAIPSHAMILAAGLGTRMRPLTDVMPKPLVPVDGKPLINHVLDRLAAVGVATAVVNVHHFADQIEQHLKPRRAPKIVISDERAAVLGTGGGVVKALPLLGDAPFFHVNADTLWIDGVKSNLERLAVAFNPTQMDALLLLAPTATSVGYAGRGDFMMAPDGKLRRRPEREVVPFVYAGVAILSPALFAGAPQGAFSLTELFDRAIEQERLYGLRLEGVWMHVGTPEAVVAAERAILASAA